MVIGIIIEYFQLLIGCCRIEMISSSLSKRRWMRRRRLVEGGGGWVGRRELESHVTFERNESGNILIYYLVSA